MDKLKMHTPDLAQRNVEKIRELFPSCVTEVADENGRIRLAVNFDQLRQELSGDMVEGSQERYRLDWPGKREALVVANMPIAKTLRPALAESCAFSTTRNLFVEGDNLDSLKLLQEAYLGRVATIYIDPPYNTGNDFVYRDQFSLSQADQEIVAGERTEEALRLVANPEGNGRFHSNWLSMIYPRLRIARNLLREDGALFVSIDDTEVAGLRHLLDEVFGAENFVTEIVWEGANKNDARQIGVSHEYVLCYVKDKRATRDNWTVSKEGVEPVLQEVARLRDIHGDNFDAASEDLAGWFRAMKATPSFAHRRFRYIDERGAYKEDDPTAPGGRKFKLRNPNTGDVIPLRPNRGWGFDQQTFNKMVEERRISFVSLTSIMVRRYLHETDRQTPQSVFYQPARSASERLSKLMGANIFDYPKDETIIQKFVDMASNQDGDIVLDFFAGSSTTAHAVLLQNAQDGKNRRFIMVQLQEPTKEGSPARAAGFATVAEISKERIRRASMEVLKGECHPDWNKDIGFRVLKIDSSNMQDVYYRPDEVNQTDLLAAVDNIKPDRTPEDLLFQVLVDWGVDLTLPIRRETVQGKTVFFVNQPPYDLVACFDTGITEELVKELTDHAPLRIVFRDTGFASDAVKINVGQIFRQLSPVTDVKSI